MENFAQPSRTLEDARSLNQRVLARFRRVTSSGNFISEIDGLRFIAIGTVVLFHLAVGLSIKAPGVFTMPREGNVLAAVARFGYHGVELFFIISGFILAYPFASHFLKGRHRVDLKQYFLRRVTRLEPPYLLCMILMFFLLVFLKGNSPAELLPHLGASLLYLHNLLYGTESVINNVAWSLEIEIQFYLLVPILSSIFAIRNTIVRRSVLAGLSVGSILVASGLAPGDMLYYSIARFLHFFLMGFLLADIFLVDWQEKPSMHFGWDIVSIVGWPLLFVVWNHADSLNAIVPEVIFPFGALVLYMAVFKGRVTNAIMTSPWIATIGGMCYTIYLFHNQVLGLVIGWTKGIAPVDDYTTNLLIQLAITTPFLLTMTAVYFLLVEKPCMRKDWPVRLYGRVTAVFSRLRRSGTIH